MSNLIKWNYINLESENRRIIDSEHSKKNPFPELDASGMSLNKGENADMEADGFREGVKTINYDDILKKEREQIEIEKNIVLSDARQQAEKLITEARAIAETIKNDAYESGHESGLIAGMAEAKEILEKEEAKIQLHREELNAAYQEKLSVMEPMIAEFMVKMLEKLTGVVVEDKAEIILYLIKTGLEQTGKSETFAVRVSVEDYPIVEAQKETLLLLMDGQGELIFKEDKGLRKNQCVIETDTAILESSLDVQLKKLAEDIRLLALKMDS